MKVERYQGLVVEVGGIAVKALSLPDWMLGYIEFPPGQMKEFRAALMKARVHIFKVTEGRIYFE